MSNMEELYFKLSNGTLVHAFYGSDNAPADENAVGYISINGITSDYEDEGGELDYYEDDKSLEDMIPDILDEMDWTGPIEFISEDEYDLASEKMQRKFEEKIRSLRAAEGVAV